MAAIQAVWREGGGEGGEAAAAGADLLEFEPVGAGAGRVAGGAEEVALAACAGGGVVEEDLLVGPAALGVAVVIAGEGASDMKASQRPSGETRAVRS